MNNKARLVLFTLFLVALTTVCKFFLAADPTLTWSGFTPVFVIALFSGFIMDKKDRSFILPLLALFISDVIIHVLYLNNLFDFAGFYGGQWKNYLILLSVTLIGWLLKGKNYTSLFAGALVAPTLYFLISNFAVWAGQEVLYSKDMNGLLNCYAAGLPFYKNSILASVLFLPLIAGVYNQLASRKRSIVVA